MLSCWGDEEASVDILAGAELTNHGPTKPLAAFCATSLAVMECCFDQDPPVSPHENERLVVWGPWVLGACRHY